MEIDAFHVLILKYIDISIQNIKKGTDKANFNKFMHLAPNFQSVSAQSVRF